MSSTENRPPTDPVSDALGGAQDGGGLLVAGIWKDPPSALYPRGRRYAFGACYRSKPWPVLCNRFDGEPPPTDDCIPDERAWYDRHFARQVAESERQAEAVRLYNEEHPDAKYGYLPVWFRAETIDRNAASAAMNGETVVLAMPTSGTD